MAIILIFFQATANKFPFYLNCYDWIISGGICLRHCPFCKVLEWVKCCSSIQHHSPFFFQIWKWIKTVSVNGFQNQDLENEKQPFSWNTALSWENHETGMLLFLQKIKRWNLWGTWWFLLSKPTCFVILLHYLFKIPYYSMFWYHQPHYHVWCSFYFLCNGFVHLFFSSHLVICTVLLIYPQDWSY